MWYSVRVCYAQISLATYERESGSRLYVRMSKRLLKRKKREKEKLTGGNGECEWRNLQSVKRHPLFYNVSLHHLEFFPALGFVDAATVWSGHTLTGFYQFFFILSPNM
ncbi:hypothetical protein TNCT_294351 [Trichonephila clavata]|uniref:Uncharacterized protein n=1 Tax=Trichonephila clavata TaxID=2740835 RepID=A0A8X6M3I0_TRICU|nr:hypothetical protein TNCT_294351 [Trichonephila clavata]